MASYGRSIGFYWNGQPVDGVREKSLNIGGQLIEIGDEFEYGYRYFLAAQTTGSKIDYSISGLVKSDILRAAKMSGDVRGVVVVAYPDGAVLSFRAAMPNYEEGAAYGDAVTFSASFVSTGSPILSRFEDGFISSTPYPVYAIAEMTGSGNPLAALQFDSLFIDSIFASGTPLSGELRDILITLVIEPEALLAAGVPQSGTLAQTLFEELVTVYDPELLSALGVPQSGTLIQTFFPINHSVFDIEQLAATGVPQSGTLT